MPLSNEQLFMIADYLAPRLRTVQFGSNVVCRQGQECLEGLGRFFAKSSRELRCIQLGTNYYFEGSMSEQDWVERAVRVDDFFLLFPASLERLEVLCPILWSFPAKKLIQTVAERCPNLKHLRLYRYLA